MQVKPNIKHKFDNFDIFIKMQTFFFIRLDTKSVCIRTHHANTYMHMSVVVVCWVFDGFWKSFAAELYLRLKKDMEKARGQVKGGS